MYRPKIKDDLVMMLRELKAVTGKPLTTMIDELLRPQVSRMYEEAFNVTLPQQLELFPVRESEPMVEVTYHKMRVNANSPDAVYRLCQDMRPLRQERLDVLTLDTKNYVTMRKTVSLGLLNASIIHPREIFAVAVEQRAASIVIVHNHPSGVRSKGAPNQQLAEKTQAMNSL